MYQILYAEITNINSYFKSRHDVETWNLNLSGVFTSSSNSLIGGAAVLKIGEAEHSLEETSVLVSVKTRPSRIEAPGTPASAAWVSNFDVRDTLRVDRLQHPSISIANLEISLPADEIDIIRKVNLNTNSLLIAVQCRDDNNDPRPLDEPASDHFFAYIEEITLHIISQKDGYRSRDYIPHIGEMDYPEDISPTKSVERIESAIQKIISAADNNRRLLLRALYVIGGLIVLSNFVRF